VTTTVLPQITSTAQALSTTLGQLTTTITSLPSTSAEYVTTTLLPQITTMTETLTTTLSSLPSTVSSLSSTSLEALTTTVAPLTEQITTAMQTLSTTLSDLSSTVSSLSSTSLEALTTTVAPLTEQITTAVQTLSSTLSGLSTTALSESTIEYLTTTVAPQLTTAAQTLSTTLSSLSSTTLEALSTALSDPSTVLSLSSTAAATTAATSTALTTGEIAVAGPNLPLILGLGIGVPLTIAIGVLLVCMIYKLRAQRQSYDVRALEGGMNQAPPWNNTDLGPNSAIRNVNEMPVDIEFEEMPSSQRGHQHHGSAHSLNEGAHSLRSSVRTTHSDPLPQHQDHGNFGMGSFSQIRRGNEAQLFKSSSHSRPSLTAPLASPENSEVRLSLQQNTPSLSMDSPTPSLNIHTRKPGTHILTHTLSRPLTIPSVQVSSLESIVRAVPVLVQPISTGLHERFLTFSTCVGDQNVRNYEQIPNEAVKIAKNSNLEKRYLDKLDQGKGNANALYFSSQDIDMGQTTEEEPGKVPPKNDQDLHLPNEFFQVRIPIKHV